ncbi:von Willebrand factor type A domain-containing protein [Mucilaginibacter ximonensis]|uniref:von Willebrand factor type A domain-containing protein n=1 Tax=Mucilaginibacter ximonensis TaxID=538021 RepID=A0ABW5YDU2_9SPHI
MKRYLILLAALISVCGIATSATKTAAVINSKPIKYVTVKGTVTDTANNPINGVSVGIAGKTFARTAFNGCYTIRVKDGEALTFVAIGYINQTIKLKHGQSELNVCMHSYTQPLNEVVVRGYIKRSRDQTTGASYIITGKEVQDNPVATVPQLLQGKVAGLNIRNNTGAPGVRGTANIRGMSVSPVYGKSASVNQVQGLRYPSSYAFSMPSNESYVELNENSFYNPLENPLSTFSTDVDAASYANVRRFINNGQLPPKDAVRIEELINYFKYNLPEPDHGDPVAIQTELATAPWNPKHQLVNIGLKAKNVEADKLPPSNLVFLIDVSGSMMEPNKLPLVKTSLKMLVDQLRPIDNVAIVTYAGYVSTPLESTKANDKQKIKDAIDGLGAGGSTAGAAGILMAYKIARDNFIKHGNNRIILATDGDFNVGPSSDKDIEQIIAEESKSKVSLSILGFGMGNFKDSKMELLADKGHGNYAYIDNITEATKAMVNEFGGTLFTVAKDVKLQVEFNPAKVQAYRLLGYEDRLMAKEDFNNDNKMGGDMGVGHTVTALYEIIPAGLKDDDMMGSVDPLKYQKTTENKAINNSPEIMTIKFRYKNPESDRSKMEQVAVAGGAMQTDKASDDFRFAAAVAEFGLLLRDSQYKQNAKYEQVIALAKSAKGKDDEGYRAEFIRLAESAMNMAKSGTVSAAR